MQPLAPLEKEAVRAYSWLHGDSSGQVTSCMLFSLKECDNDRIWTHSETELLQG